MRRRRRRRRWRDKNKTDKKIQQVNIHIAPEQLGGFALFHFSGCFYVRFFLHQPPSHTYILVFANRKLFVFFCFDPSCIRRRMDTS